MKILNLTQHNATPEQNAAGVVDMPAELAEEIRAASTFDTVPTPVEMLERAEHIASLVAMCDLNASSYDEDGMPGAEEYPTHVMIGGAPFFMGVLERALLSVGLTPLYAFSVRESAEQAQPDGSVRKINVFRHTGFVEATRDIDMSGVGGRR